MFGTINHRADIDGFGLPSLSWSGWAIVTKHRPRMSASPPIFSTNTVIPMGIHRTVMLVEADYLMLLNAYNVVFSSHVQPEKRYYEDPYSSEKTYFYVLEGNTEETERLLYFTFISFMLQWIEMNVAQRNPDLTVREIKHVHELFSHHADVFSEDLEFRETLDYVFTGREKLPPDWGFDDDPTSSFFDEEQQEAYEISMEARGWHHL